MLTLLQHNAAADGEEAKMRKQGLLVHAAAAAAVALVAVHTTLYCGGNGELL